MKNVWTAQEGEMIAKYIMDGDSVEVAKAKVMIKKDEELGKQMAEIYVPNVMLTDRAEQYKELCDSSMANRKAMIEIFGKTNFSIYNMASKKNKLNALVYGKRNPKVGFQLKKSTGCFGIEA
jgi:hypothetical protein